MSAINSGDVVYFKTVKKESKRKAPDINFKGTGFGIFLGAVPLFGKDPQPIDILRGIGSIGFMPFDDVAEFIGEEAARTCVEKFETKYYGRPLTDEEKTTAEAQAAKERGEVPADEGHEETDPVVREIEGYDEIKKEPSKLLNAHGMSLVPQEGEPLIIVPGVDRGPAL